MLQHSCLCHTQAGIAQTGKAFNSWCRRLPLWPCNKSPQNWPLVTPHIFSQTSCTLYITRRSFKLFTKRWPQPRAPEGWQDIQHRNIWTVWYFWPGPETTWSQWDQSFHPFEPGIQKAKLLTEFGIELHNIYDRGRPTLEDSTSLLVQGTEARHMGHTGKSGRARSDEAMQLAWKQCRQFTNLPG